MKQRLFFIIGCTACGKGSTGRVIARRIGAQIISVDSMKIYRRMDIGTAKPSADIRREIPHHCLDLVEPGESFSVARYVAAADDAISQISAAGATPLAVGGTSLYIKALSEGLFEGQSSPLIRKELHERAAAGQLPAMHAELQKVDPQAAAKIHPNDEKRIVRALEVFYSSGQPISDQQKQWDTPQHRYDCVFIGLRRDKDDLNRRINLRVKKMVDAGLRDEVAALLAEPAGLSPQAAAAIGYAEVIEHFQGKCSYEDAVERIKINTRHLAKKQRTWHRRWAGVHWYDLSPDEPPEITADKIMADHFADARRAT